MLESGAHLDRTLMLVTEASFTLVGSWEGERVQTELTLFGAAFVLLGVMVVVKTLVLVLAGNRIASSVQECSATTN